MRGRLQTHRACCSLARTYPYKRVALAWQAAEAGSRNCPVGASREGMAAASDANRALAVAQVKAVEAKSAQLAKDNQDHEQDLRAQFGARSVAYADRMRADAYCRSTACPRRRSPAPVDHGPGADAVILGRKTDSTSSSPTP